MRQTLHIFLKDVRHLRYEIAAAVFISATFAFTGARRALAFTEPGANQGIAWGLLLLLLPLIWWILIARVIHAEALPGHRQFWLTRPYVWKSLLAAKTLFILIFVNLGLLIADVVIVRAFGFSIVHEIPGLLWTQVLLIAAFVLPVAALSALTPGFLQLILTILTFSIAALAWTIFLPVLGFGRNMFWMELEWIRIYSALLVVAAASLIILIWQYARRRTFSTRATAGAATLLVLFGLPSLPWTTAYAIQSRLSSQHIDPSFIHVALDSNRMWAAHALVESKDQVRIELPLQITKIPPDTEVKPDGLTVILEAPGVTPWRADQHPWANLDFEWRMTSLDTTVNGSFYENVRKKPLTVHGSLYFTLYGNRHATNIPFQNRSVPVPDVGLCSAGRGPGIGSGMVFCSSAFQPRRDLVFFSFIASGQGTSQPAAASSRPQLLSYSPFPAELSLEPVSQFFSFNLQPGAFAGVTVETFQPLAHIRRDFEIRDLHLSEFEVRLSPIQ
jgi:hypothetical protein